MFVRRIRRGLAPIGAVAALGLALAAGSARAQTVNDLDNGPTPEDLANSLIGAGVTISNVTYTGANRAAGVFSGGAAGIGFDRGVVLGSGKVQTRTGDPVCSNGVEAPNNCFEGSPTGPRNTSPLNTPGDADLKALAGFDTFDAAVLEFDFVPQFSTIQFRYVFSSEEYNEFANTEFNDVFAFFVNGTNCALVPSTTEPVAVNTINNGNPNAGRDPTPHHPELFRDNVRPAPSLPTEMDGLTVTLTCNATVNAGVSNHMKLAIADSSDLILDSAVFIEAGSFVSGTQISTVLSGGGLTGTAIEVPARTSVTDTAALAGVQVGTATGTVTYTVYSDNTCTTMFANAGTVMVTGGVVPPSNPVAFDAAGTYYWVAAYSGDAMNNPSRTACGEETVTVLPPPPPESTCGCKLKYVGVIRPSFGQKAAVQGAAIVFKGKPRGRNLYFDFLSVKHHFRGMKVETLGIDRMVCTEHGATLEGMALVNRREKVRYHLELLDVSWRGYWDRYQLKLDNGFDTGSERLLHGNIFIDPD